MYPLLVSGCHGKGINALLGDLQPGATMDFTVDLRLVTGDQIFAYKHIPVPPLHKKMVAKGSPAMLSQI
jgi:hypothetical protein